MVVALMVESFHYKCVTKHTTRAFECGRCGTAGTDAASLALNWNRVKEVQRARVQRTLPGCTRTRIQCVGVV